MCGLLELCWLLLLPYQGTVNSQCFFPEYFSGSPKTVIEK